MAGADEVSGTLLANFSFDGFIENGEYVGFIVCHEVAPDWLSTIQCPVCAQFRTWILPNFEKDYEGAGVSA